MRPLSHCPNTTGSPDALLKIEVRNYLFGVSESDKAQNKFQKLKLIGGFCNEKDEVQ